MPNGLTFDISDDNQFKAYVAQHIGILVERTEGLKEIKVAVPLLKQEVDDIKQTMKDDKFWGNIKAYSGPVLVALHIAAKKIGLNI